MRVLFDNGVPWAVARVLVGHEVTYARRIGWHELRNGELLARAELDGFDVLLTTDKNIQHQQNLSGRRIAVLVLSHPQWPDVRRNLERIAAAVNEVLPGSYGQIELDVRRDESNPL